MNPLSASRASVFGESPVIFAVARAPARRIGFCGFITNVPSASVIHCPEMIHVPSF
jgi:hypothetical protein